MIAIKKPAFFALIATVAFASPMALAQDKAAAPAATQSQLGIDQLDCRALLRLSGEERSYTILYLHGFVSGRKNQTLVPAQQMALATDRVVDHCIDRPGDKLLPVFEKVRGN